MRCCYCGVVIAVLSLRWFFCGVVIAVLLLRCVIAARDSSSRGLSVLRLLHCLAPVADCCIMAAGSLQAYSTSLLPRKWPRHSESLRVIPSHCESFRVIRSHSGHLSDSEFPSQSKSIQVIPSHSVSFRVILRAPPHTDKPVSYTMLTQAHTT